MGIVAGAFRWIYEYIFAILAIPAKLTELFAKHHASQNQCSELLPEILVMVPRGGVLYSGVVTSDTDYSNALYKLKVKFNTLPFPQLSC